LRVTHRLLVAQERIAHPFQSGELATFRSACPIDGVGDDLGDVLSANPHGQ
jgi:hypothetical protein